VTASFSSLSISWRDGQVRGGGRNRGSDGRMRNGMGGVGSDRGVGPSERNPVRTKASFDLMRHMFSFCWTFVPMGFRSSGTALCSVLPTDCNEIY